MSSNSAKTRGRFAGNEDAQTLVVIGNGMVSWKLCHRLVELGAHEEIRIVVFGDELVPAYDRVHLTNILAGTPEEKLILAPKEWYEEHGIELHLDDPVVHVDREECVVVSASGCEVEYNRLVFATGSRPFVPPVEGIDLKGVFIYRTLDDVYAIEEHSMTVTRAAVLGGGLLGLEAAKAIHDLYPKRRIKIDVIEHGPGLMHRQIDIKGADILRQKIEALGVKVHVQKELDRIVRSSYQAAASDGAGASYRVPPPELEPEPTDEGDERLLLQFTDGTRILTDMVVLAAGVRPRGELAQACGLTCAPNGGIIVDERLETSDKQIFAIGECASFRGATYGLVLPGYQMVDVLVTNLMGGSATFEGADQSAKLKVLGVTVAALGEYDGENKPLSSALRYTTGGVYRKLVTRNGRLIGAVTVGDWENLDRIRDTLRAPVPTSFWDMRRFRSTGNLWPRSESQKVADWAPDALVCGCMQVTRGTLSLAIAEGCSSASELSRKTGAGSMCGSCQPLLADLLGVDENYRPPVAVSIGATVSIGEGDSSSGPSSQRPSVRSRRTSLPLPSERGAPRLPPASVRGGPSSVRGGPSSGHDVLSGVPSFRGVPSSGHELHGPPSMRGGPMSTRDAGMMPQSRGARGARSTRTSTPPPARGSSLPADSSRISSIPPPRGRRNSAPPPAQKVATPLPPRLSSAPPAMTFSAPEPADLEDPGPVSIRRPSVGPPPRKSRAERSSIPPLRSDVPPEAGERISSAPEALTRASSLPERAPRASSLPEHSDGASALPEYGERLSSLPEHDERLSSLSELDRRSATPPLSPELLAQMERTELVRMAMPELEQATASEPPPPLTLPPDQLETAMLEAAREAAPPPEPVPALELGASEVAPQAEALAPAQDEAPPQGEREAEGDADEATREGDAEADDHHEDEHEDEHGYDDEEDDGYDGAEGEDDEEYEDDYGHNEDDNVFIEHTNAPLPKPRRELRRSWVPPQRKSQLPIMPPARVSRPTITVERGLKPLLFAAVTALVLAPVLYAGPILSERVLRYRSSLAMLGDSTLLKQATGYALVALTAVSLLISLRKRWKRFALADVPFFRMIHGLLGAATLFMLTLHTSLQLGQHMVMVLALDFISIALLGSFAGIVTYLSPRWSPVAARNRRLFWSRVHLVLFWPLPVLITLHVIQVYFY